MVRRLGIALALAAAGACFTHDGGSPGDAGDASDATADAQDGGVGAIFAASCALGGCHLGPSAPMKLDLSPSAYVANLVGVPAAELYQTLRVAPGEATDTQSYLLCKVDPECAVVGDHMPLGSGLSSADIATLRAWVASLPPSDAGFPLSGIDSTPPTFAGASAATGGPSSITLSWSPATDDVTATSDVVYLVYQASAQGAEDFAAPTYTTPPGATSFAVGKLAPSTKAWFVVRARDLAGNVDGNDVEVNATSATTSDTTPPTFGGATSATAQSAGTVLVSWTAATDDVSPPSQIGYSIYASTTSGGESFATPTLVTLPGATSAAVSGLAGDTLYFFVVRASDQAGNFDANAIEVSAKTAPVSFTNDVFPVFQSTCATAGCHVLPNPAEGIDLGTPSGAHASLVSVPSAECTSESIVTPSSPQASYLLEKLRGYGPCFTGARMPEQGAPLSASSIDLVSAWIGKGAPLD